MYSRSNSIVLSLPTNNFFQDNFSFSSMPRSKEPEIFTFEQIPAQFQPRPAAFPRQRKKHTRVMYPSNVRKYLPPAEKSAAKRWLVILCLVVFLQIWTEEGVIDTQTDSAVQDSSCEETPFAQYQVLPLFQSAEEQARQMRSDSVESPVNEQERLSSEQNSWSLLPNTTCLSCTEEIKCTPEQSTNNGYVVALLYPVYHTLGSDNWKNWHSRVVKSRQRTNYNCLIWLRYRMRARARRREGQAAAAAALWWPWPISGSTGYTQIEGTLKGLALIFDITLEWHLNGL